MKVFKKLAFSFMLMQILALNSAFAESNDVTSEINLIPEELSNAVSNLDMQVRLAAKSNAAACAANNCESNLAFDLRVKQLGAALSASAYEVYPTLKKRVSQFDFSVIEKLELGAASNGAGKVIIFRGVQDLQLSDDALSFIVAREMGHVIGKHHNKNISTKLIISALASIAFPALAVITASTAAQATTATSLITSAASTATSMLGGEVALAKMKPSQLTESDAIAMTLLNQTTWNLHTTASELQFDTEMNPPNNWLQDVQISNAALQNMLDVEVQAIMPLDDFVYTYADAQLPLDIDESVSQLQAIE
jgi:predicted Zn-dependent protease